MSEKLEETSMRAHSGSSLARWSRGATLLAWALPILLVLLPAFRLLPVELGFNLSLIVVFVSVFITPMVALGAVLLGHAARSRLRSSEPADAGDIEQARKRLFAAYAILALSLILVLCTVFVVRAHNRAVVTSFSSTGTYGSSRIRANGP